MGRDIVHAENPDFPGERSRLWHPEDVNDVLIDKSGTEKIEGLALNLPSLEETCFSTEAFRNMKRLRLLQLNNVQLAGGYQCLFKKLRWLCWHGFPLEFIPIELCQPNIVAIDMQYSSLRQVLCEYSGLLDKLKILNLSHSHDLTQSPDFSKFPNLEKLILKDCKRLAKVHKSIGDLKSLVLVNLKDCETLKALPRSFYKLKSVKTLVLDGCSRFQSLCENLGEMASLVTLYADGTAIKKVPPSIIRLEKLERLSLSKLKCSLQLPSLQGLRSLTSLILADSNIEEVLNDIGSSLPCLVELCLDDNNFGSLPILSGLSKLLILSLNGCRNLVKITDLPKNLGFLHMDDCFALERIPGLDSALNSGLVLGLITHNNVIDFVLKDSTLQGWTGGGTMVLAGRQIPTWFNHVNEGTQVSFEVPKEIGSNAKALAVCLDFVPHDYASSFYIYVINHTKGTSFCVEILDVFPLEEIIWLGNLSLSETEFNLGESDLVHVIAHCPVKKIGVRLICDKLMTFKGSLFDYHYIPYERALEEISTEVDDFDEDYEDDDFDEDDDKTMRNLMGMMRRILMRIMRRRRNKTMMRTNKVLMLMMRVMMRRTKTTTTM
ncbi:hypothetical protein ACFXTH_010596 [Malus domestica]